MPRSKINCNIVYISGLLGASTLGTTSFSITTVSKITGLILKLSIMTFSITTVSIITGLILTHSIMTFRITTLSRKG